MAHRRTSPRRSGDSESAEKNTRISPGPTLKKAKNKRGSIFNCLIFIKVLRELSKHTTYLSSNQLITSNVKSTSMLSSRRMIKFMLRFGVIWLDDNIDVTFGVILLDDNVTISDDDNYLS